mmetsp:Transcript_49266/g.73326  ORF Transcript_49266/g.73326 Transcript_49266/m.73326 type:complete len:87 (-) Transcript_49266:37-297(-)
MGKPYEYDESGIIMCCFRLQNAIHGTEISNIFCNTRRSRICCYCVYSIDTRPFVEMMPEKTQNAYHDNVLDVRANMVFFSKFVARI